MDVTNINNLSEPERSQNAKKVQVKKQNDYITVLSKRTLDNISISETAKAALEENKLLNIVENLPTVRQDLIAKLKSEVENDTLLSEEALNETAEKIFKGLFG